MTTFKITAGENLWISVDGNPEKFSHCTPGQTYTVTTKCLLAGKGTQSIYGIEGDFTKVSGNALTLIDCDDPTSVTLIDSQFFNGTDKGLFTSTASTGCTAFEDASDLELNSASVPASAYKSMFQGCPALTKAPSLPGATVGQEAYADMFNGCDALTTAPASLPAATASEGAYQNMFKGCAALETAPSISATSVGKNACNGMFESCTELTAAPTLSAETISEACYKGMFKDCSKMETAPAALPATTLAKDCYNSMFQSTKIETAPTMTASTLSEGCYEAMFKGCASLKTGISSLPAQTLETGCYKDMFNGCANLEGPISIAATTAPSTTVTGDMFTNSGTSHPTATTTTDVVKINVTTNNADWNLANAGIDTTYWTVPSNVILLEGDPDTFASFKFTSGANIQVSNDGETWSTLSAGTTAPVTDGKIYVRGKSGSTPVYGFTGNFTKVSGNAMYLVDYENVETVALSANQFSPSSTDGGLFYNIASLVDASGFTLPRASLATSCYKWMFRGCTSLTTAPALPATTLATACYSSMFYGCTSLTTPPALPATSLVSACYEFMFGDSGIETAPALPATSLASNCYNCMFYGCTAMTSAPSLPATTLTIDCYRDMFNSCSSLKTAPTFGNVTSIASGSCFRMLMDCPALEGPIDFSAWTITPDASNIYLMLGGTTGYSHLVSEHPGEDICKLSFPIGDTRNAWIINSGANPSYWEFGMMPFVVLYSPSYPWTFKFSAGARIQYSTNGSTWSSTLSPGTSYSMSSNFVVLRGTSGTSPVFGFHGSFTKVSGNVMALVDYNNIDTVALNSSQFTSYNNVQGLFVNVTTLIDASGLELPRTTLSTKCYNRMFAGCSALESAPALPATTLAKNCYAGMFLSCPSLTSAPALPATSLADGCYSGMFSNCTNLTGPVYIYATSPFYDGSTTACDSMFTNTGTSRPSTPTDYNKIKVGGTVSLWNQANCGIDSTKWTVELIS